MKSNSRFAHLLWLLLFISLLLSPLQAQTRPSSPNRAAARPATREVVPTFDALLATKSYKVYGEIRGVGQLIRSTAVNDLLDPVMRLSSPPKEFKTLVKWLNAHADEVITSRMMFATSPSRAKLPQFICAIEFPSAEEAQKFEPKLRQFLPRVIPSPSPTPAEAPKEAQTTKGSDKPVESAPPYVIKHAGTLVLISTSTFTFRSLRPANSKLLVEDPEFRQVRDRFAAEQAFIYFDMNAINQEEEEQRRKAQQQYEEQKKVEAEAAAKATPEPAVVETPDVVSADDGAPAMDPAPAVPSVELPPSGVGPPEPQPPSAATQAFYGLMDGFFIGPAKWPDAIGLALNFDTESLNVRMLLVNPPEAKGTFIPFAPQLISGPHITSAAATIMPADTEMFITASLDYNLIHDGMVKTFADRVEQMEKAQREAQAMDPLRAISYGDETVTSPFASYEKLLGIKLKDDLLPLLGNEIAVSLPLTEMFKPPTPPPAEGSKEDAPASGEKKPEPAPVIAIAIKDREGVKALLPKIIESMGLKGASLVAQTERRGDTELINYANIFAYAFIGDFLVVSTQVAATRHVVDSYVNHQTLASDSRFRNSTRWQPRQVLGQVYIAQGLAESMNGVSIGAIEMSEKIRDMLSRLSPHTEPLTYALYNEGLGPLHELHIPKNILIMFVASFAVGTEMMSLEMNESMAQNALRTIVSAQESYKGTTGKGSYGSIDQLVSAGLFPKEMLGDRGYKIEATVSATRFEVRAMPLEYGRSGKQSFFVDETGVLRGADLGGGPATVSDKPVQQ